MASKNQKRSLSKTEIKRKQASEAMPEVKALVKKYNLEVVNYCLGQLKEYDKKLRQLERMKSETRAVARELRKI